ncbi:unnamed protein product [Brassicogethes aeneus]|uniref:Uncharacterized protein n=1 Tax=Brassicogethes aeneus TaxID=1431903 RepID=A0A9P0FMF9_BRAAE|nr:unnamed protein product [Brassicogethes aeneus]
MRFDESQIDNDEIEKHTRSRRNTKMVLPSKKIELDKSLIVDEKIERKRNRRKTKKKYTKKVEFEFKDVVGKIKKKSSKMQTYKAEVKWWQKASMSYSMYQVRETMEKLMGSNTVTILDRAYMLRLKCRILEYFAEIMQKRIKEKEGGEYQRGKHLVLTGKIPFEEAPEAMAEHPVIILENYCNELIEKRRAMLQLRRPKIPNYLYWDDTPDPPFRLSIEMGHKFRSKEDILCKLIDMYLLSTEEEDIANGIIFEEHEYKRMKYVDLLVRRLMAKMDVMEVYDLADEIMKKDTPEVVAAALRQARREAGFVSNLELAMKLEDDEDDEDEEYEEEDEGEEDEEGGRRKMSKDSRYSSVDEEKAEDSK